MSNPASAQKNHFIVPVDFQVVNSTMDNTIVKVKKNGGLEKTLSGKTSLRLKLDFNNNYVISFSKEGFITKSIEVATDAPEERLSRPVNPYMIGVRLFKQYQGVNIVVYNQPVAKIHFNATIDEFDYDTDYSKSILSELNDADQQLNVKATEERLAASGTMKSVSTENNKEQNNSLSSSGQMSVRSLINDPGTPVEKQSAFPDPVYQNKRNISGVDGGMESQTKLANTGGSDDRAQTDLQQGTDSEKEESTSQSIVPNISTLIPGQGDDAGNQLKENSGADIHSDALQVLGEATYYRLNWLERGREITTFKVINGLNIAEYRKVAYDWGGIFYFKDQHFTISQNVYQWATGEK